MTAYAGIFKRIQPPYINGAMLLASVAMLGVIVVQALTLSTPVARPIYSPAVAHPAAGSGSAGTQANPVPTVTGAGATRTSRESSASVKTTHASNAQTTRGAQTVNASAARVQAPVGTRVGSSTLHSSSPGSSTGAATRSAAGSIITGTGPVSVLGGAPAGLTAKTATSAPTASSSTTVSPAPTASSPSPSAPVSAHEASSATSALDNAAPAGPDGTWITPPVPASGTDPALPGVATGPAPTGDVLALGGPGSEYAFDVTTHTWILSPTNGVSYEDGVGWVSGNVSNASTDDPPPTLSSVPAGPDGAWIVAPIAAAIAENGTSLPALPGVAVGPAPAGDVMALGPADSEYAFDVSTHTWILQSSSSYTYQDGVGYVSAGAAG